MKLLAYDPSKPLKYKTPTAKQKVAWERNWNVFKLRGFYNLVPSCVSKQAREKIQKLIDAELKKLGAESETARQEKRRRKIEDA